jgi:hypothetical protein
MYSTLFKTGLSAIWTNRNKIRMAASDSLISFTEAARVEPIVLIDQSVMHTIQSVKFSNLCSRCFLVTICKLRH